MNSISKESIRSYYKKKEFPKDLINKDAFVYKDLLFSDETMGHANNKNFSNSYFMGDDTMNNKRKTWKTDNKIKKVERNIPQTSLSQSNQSFMISGTEEPVAQTKVSHIFTDNVVNEIEKVEFFIPFNLKYLFGVNDKLKIPKTEPLWYIKSGSRYLMGPMSSKEIEELYVEKKLDGRQDLRFIDNFKVKGKEAYSFFKLKDLEDLAFIKNIEIPSMNKYSEELEKIRELGNVQKAKPKFEQLEVKPKPVKQESKLLKHVKPDVNISKITIPITSGPSFIEEEEEKEVKKETTKKNNKKQKGKPVDLNVKLGFFTLTEQEKDYEPIIIVGNKDD
jgi:hypothetical protein